jgi:hypothetical protein
LENNATSKASFAYMDVGKEREHDCMDAGGRATQEQLPRSGSFGLQHHLASRFLVLIGCFRVAFADFFNLGTVDTEALHLFPQS